MSCAQGNVDGVQPIEELFTDLSQTHACVHEVIGGGHHPQTWRLVDRLSLQESTEFRLGFERHVLEMRQQQRLLRQVGRLYAANRSCGAKVRTRRLSEAGAHRAESGGSFAADSGVNPLSDSLGPRRHRDEISTRASEAADIATSSQEEIEQFCPIHRLCR